MTTNSDTPPAARDDDRLWRRVLVLCAILTAGYTALADIPASVAPLIAGFSKRGVAYEGASGTIWRGVLHGVSLGGARVGDVAFTTDAFALLGGAARAKFSVNGGALRGDGAATVNLFKKVTLRNVAVTLDLSAFRTMRVLDQPVQGAARVTISRLDLTGDRCARAEGMVTTDVLAVVAQAYNKHGFPMSGALACRNGELSLALAGHDDGLSATAELRLKKGFKIASSAALKSADPEIALALQTLGFRNEGGVWRAETRGVRLGG